MISHRPAQHPDLAHSQFPPEVFTDPPEQPLDTPQVLLPLNWCQGVLDPLGCSDNTDPLKKKLRENTLFLPKKSFNSKCIGKISP